MSKLFDLLTPADRRQMGLLVLMMVVAAFIDMLGVASILPFMAVLADPEQVLSNSQLNAAFRAAHQLGIYSVDQFLLSLGVLVFLLLLASLALKALNLSAQTRFALTREYSIGKRLIEAYLQQPYSWFLNRNSAELGKNILSEVSAVIEHGMTPLMNLITHSAVVLAMLILLLLVEPRLALTIGAALGLAYAAIYFTARRWLKRLGNERVAANKERFRSVSEVFGAIKEVNVAGLEQVYLYRFAKSAELFARGQSSAVLISQIPRFAVEAIAFGGMLTLVLYLLATTGGFSSAIPTVALYAFAGYRLLPALQNIFGSLAQIRFVTPALNSLHEELRESRPLDSSHGDVIPLDFRSSIKLEAISYSYPRTQDLALERIDLTIPAHTTIAFVGSTGSGKTTLVDVILGLLEPQDGRLSVDGQPITAANRRQWQRIIGYVPQHIYLADSSVAANIAFGISVDRIDQKAVEQAAKIASIHEFVRDELPQGYATVVGERGVRLSGGQRQRIGIARALYHSPQILILDEATSALDNITEREVMRKVNNLREDITIILVAHRLSTVRQCDNIFMLDAGSVIASGTYDQLIASNSSFKSFAKSEER